MRIPEFPIVVALRAAGAPGEPDPPGRGVTSPPGAPGARAPEAAGGAPLARHAQAPPERPVALVSGAGSGARVRAANRAAQAAGVLPGVHTAARARSCAANLRLLPWDDDLLAQEDLTVLTHLMAHSPGVARAAPGRYWVDARGLRRRGGEAAFLEALAAALGELGYPEARLAIASSVTAAEVATLLPGPRARIVPPDPTPPPGHGPDARFLAPLPLALLPLPEDLADTLEQLALQTLGELAALPTPALEMRFGAAGLRAQARARGHDPRGPLWGVGPQSRLVEVPLEPPAETLPPLIFAARTALVALTRATPGHRFLRLRLHLHLDALGAPDARDRPPLCRDIGLGSPTRRLEPLLDRCRAALEAAPLPAPVLSLGVELLESSRHHRGEQGDLFDRRFRDTEALEAALARIRARCGPDSVARPVAVDTHQPEADGRWLPDPLPPSTPLPPAPPAPAAAGADRAAPSCPDGHASAAPEAPLAGARRILPRAEAVQIRSAPGATLPVAARLDGQWHELRVLRRVLQSGDWWREDAWSRQLFTVQTRAGARLHIARPAGRKAAPAPARQGAPLGSDPDSDASGRLEDSAPPWRLLGWDD